MVLSLLLVVICAVSASGGTISDTFIPDTPEIVKSLSHTILLKVNSTNVPAGTTVVEIALEEIDDLTGNQFESGYKFGYNAAYPYFYYPQVDSGKYMKFRLHYSSGTDEADLEYGNWSPLSNIILAGTSRVELRNTPRTYKDAEDQCWNEQKRLAVIHSETMNDKLKVLLQYDSVEGDDSPAFIGLYDDNYNNGKKTPNFQWIDNSSIKKKEEENFLYGDLDNESKVALSAVVMNPDGRWERVSPAKKMRFFCETGKEESPAKDEHKRGIDSYTILKLEENAKKLK